MKITDNGWFVSKVLCEGNSELIEMGIKAENEWMDIAILLTEIVGISDHNDGTQLILKNGPEIIINERYQDMFDLLENI